MRNLRKLTAAVLAIALVLTSMTAAFAASTNEFEAQAKVLQDLKIMVGNDEGDLMLDKNLSRIQGAVLVLKTVLGKTDADQVAADTAILSTFVDADKVPTWATGWMALAVKEGVIIGTTKKELLANGSLYGKDLASMFMNTLGFSAENVYNKAVELLAAKSASTLVDAALISELTSAKLTRDAAAAIVFDALTATAKDGTRTVIENYVGTSATLMAIAVKAGLIEAVLKYVPVLKAEKEVLKADGASSTLVTFSLRDGKGNLITDAKDVEVAFSTTYGSFGEKRVTLQNGVATVMLTSEFLEVNRIANLTALIVEASNKEFIGLKAELKVIMSPNPDEIATETLGASMVSAEANQADRVTVYFNKDVDVSKFVFAAVANKGMIDPAKAEALVRTGTINSTSGSAVQVKGFMPVAGNSRAMQILLDVEASPANVLIDNTNVWVSFTDKTGSVPVTRELTFKLTDARKPAMLGVTHKGLRTLKVTFSESLQASAVSSLSNWSIDGILLSNTLKWGSATVTSGAFDVAEGIDSRNVITITLGDNKYFTSGSHSIQAANIGDWAYGSDSNNVMNTQTLDFVIPVDNTQPIASVEVQSPEQWLVTYSSEVYESAAQFAAGLKLQKYNTTSGTWQDDYTQPLSVTKIDGDKFLVEATIDWTYVHNTAGTLKNYFNSNYQLKVAKDAVTNVANGLKNVEQSITLAGAMASPDTSSPVIADIVEKVAGKEYKAVMSEPVKLGSANNEGTTLAQGQGIIPVVTADFIKSDFSKTVSGTVGAAFVDNHDKEFNVIPAQTLDAGKWILVIRSISDDIGNTAASVTKEFTVAGTVASSEFKITWAFADIDADMVVENSDPLDSDSTYDYVFIKFTKPVATSGDYKNALKTANYTLNGLALPSGTQIFANIAGYDDMDSVVDSITIRLPQSSLQGLNSPKVINVSSFIESTTAGEKLTNAGEKVLKLSIVSADFIQFTTDIATRNLVNAVAVAKDACITTTGAINVAAIPAFVTAYNTAKASIDAPVVGVPVGTAAAKSYVKEQYLAAINAYKASVSAATGFTTTLVATIGAATSTLTFTVNLTQVLPANYTATTSNPFVATVSGGTVTVVSNGTTIISVTDSFWNVSKILTLTVVGGVVTAQV